MRPRASEPPPLNRADEKTLPLTEGLCLVFFLEPPMLLEVEGETRRELPVAFLPPSCRLPAAAAAALADDAEKQKSKKKKKKDS